MLERESKHVRIGSTISIDQIAMTETEHINPARDGVYARKRNRVLRYRSDAVIRTGISAAGGLAAKHILNQPSMNSTGIMTNNQTDFEEISNPLSSN